MKKVSGTRRLLAVVFTIAMLLQNSAGVLATDSANAVSDLSQEQSTEQQIADAIAEQSDAEAQGGGDSDASKKNEAPETAAPETQTPQTDAPQTEAPETVAPEIQAEQADAPQTEAPETTAQETQAPQTDAPETAAPETQAAQTDAPETMVPETEAPETNAPETQAPQTETHGTNAPETTLPETQETIGLTQPDGETGNETNGNGTNVSVTGISAADAAATGIGESAIAPIDLPAPIASDVTITYEARIGDTNTVGEPGGGTVDPTSEKIIKGSKKAQGSTATAAEGYEFVQWAYKKAEGVYGHGVSDKNILSNDNILKKQPGDTENKTYTEDMTFVALFKKTETTITVKTSDASAGKIRSDDKSSDSVDQLVIPVGDSVKASDRACKAIKIDNHEFRGWRLEDGKDYFSTKEDLKYGTIYEAVTGKNAGDTVTFTDDVVIIADFETDKNKHIGYNLINSCDVFDDTTGLKDEGPSSGGGQKYSYQGVAYAIGDTYTAPIQYVPHCTKGEHVFVGWFDKRGGKKSGKDDVAIVLQPGGTGIYNNNSAVQTLDAIWISVSANDITTVYDGKYHKPTSDKNLSVENSDNKDYTTDVKKALKTQQGIDVDEISVTAKYNGGFVPEDGFVDVGEYNLEYFYTVGETSASKK